MRLVNNQLNKFEFKGGEYMNIVKSSNYDQFGTLLGNRKISKDHVNRLVRSIQEKNMLEENPIIVATGKVIDGQHRLEAAKKLKIPFYYIEREVGDLEDVRRLNVYTKPWIITDYLNSYIDLGNEDYIILKGFMNKYNLPITVSIALLAGMSSVGTITLAPFKNGHFKITHPKEAEEEAEALLKLKPHTEGQIWRTRDFIGAIKQVWKKVDKDVFLQKLIDRGEKIHARLTRREYLRDFEDMYNFGLKINQIRFYT